MNKPQDREHRPADRKPGIELPGYRIESLLGRGGMAAVYLAIQESFGREVAIKILEPGQAATENFSERFLREAKIVSRLSHPNIVTVYDVGIHAGYHYYSMEYVEGPNLKQALPELSLEEKLRIVKEVARALDFAGNKGYVHRDIKPENILIRKMDGHVVLTDFGIARGEDLTQGMTQTGRAIGTPHYMSPEQTKGLRVDPRSDIYSLGVVLYLLLSGRIPYDAESAIAVGIKHLSAPIPALPPQMKIFQGIINTCLSKSPEHRYQRASELSAALEAIPPQAIRAIDARRPVPDQIQHDVHAATMADSDAVASSPMPDNATPTISSTRTPASGTTTRQRTPRRRRAGATLILLLIVLLGGALAGIWQQRAEFVRLWNYLDLPDADELLATFTGEPVVDTPLEAVRSASRTTSSSSSAPEQGVDPVQYLYQQLEADPANARILAQTYRARLQNEPPDSEARQGLQLMQQWFQEQLQGAFDRHDVPRARQLIAAMQQSFPRLSSTPRFAQLRRRLARAEQAQDYLEQAEQYVQQQALIAPDGANALAAYRSALEQVPNHPQARQGIKRLVDHFHNQAIQHKTRGEFDPALARVESGLSIRPQDPELTKLQQELQAMIATRDQVSALNARAANAFAEGKLLQPANDSAFHYYQQALELLPDNSEARQGLLKIQQQKLLKVQFEIREKNFEQAETLLNDLEGWFGKTESINRSWETLFSAIEKSLPRISGLTYGDLEIASLDISRPDVLRPIRNLFFGFAYENLPAEQNQVETYLMDSTGRIPMAHKTLTLERQEGEYFDNLLLPINEMQDGRYRLVLRLNDKTLHQSSLYIDIQ